MNGPKEIMKNERERKFDFVYELVVRGERYMNIVRAFAEKFGDTERNAKNYIKKVDRHLANPAPQERAKAKNKAIAQYEDLYRLAYAKGDTKQCTTIRAHLDRLEGLDKIIIDQTVNSNQPAIDLIDLPLDLLLKMQQHLPGSFIDVVTDVTFSEVGEDAEEDAEDDEDEESN